MRVFLAVLVMCALTTPVFPAERRVTIGYLEQLYPQPPILYNLDDRPSDEGLFGARLALADNSTTGKFLNTGYDLTEEIVPDGGDLVSAARAMLEKTPFLVVVASQADLLRIADLAEAQNALLFNAGSADIALRDDACRHNVLHTLPSRDMLTDALAQFAQARKWTELALISGERAEDQAYADAMTKSAAKFGLTIVGRKKWSFNADMRRNAAQEVPLFTQDFDDQQLLVVADEAGDFARYIPYNTWLPRPVAGTEGLIPAGWSATVEANGAVQLQNRFRKLAGRNMTSRDYAAWAAVRSVGEAVTRVNKTDAGPVRDYILSDAFKLAGFKGAPLTYRTWNGQLRQPIPLTHSRAMAMLAPLDGFLHQHNPLDTLGMDEPESKCDKFKR